MRHERELKEYKALKEAYNEQGMIRTTCYSSMKLDKSFSDDQEDRNEAFLTPYLTDPVNLQHVYTSLGEECARAFIRAFAHHDSY